MKKRQSDKKTKQVRIDTELHGLFKIKAAKDKLPMKTILEELVIGFLELNNGTQKA